jgi:predicted Zn-dependent protease
MKSQVSSAYSWLPPSSFARSASAFAPASADRRSLSGGWSADRRSLGGGWSGGSIGAFLLATLLSATSAQAQIGGILNKAQKVKSTADKVADMNITDQQERQIGEQVSTNLRNKYGVYQDQDVAKYVSLVGTVLAQASTRPTLDWKFIVLDTDGVNAFASPGGFIHITRGLLGLIKNEAELAGVLGHEITHVTAKHTIRYIQQGKMVSLTADEAGGGSYQNALVAKVSEKAYHLILDGEFSRDDENEADKIGVQLANKLGYAPSGLVDVLKKIDARNSGREDRNGLFASHPATKDRIAKLENQIKVEKLAGTATVAARYAQNIKFDAKPVTDLAMNVDGAAGLAGDGNDSKDTKDAKDSKDAKPDEPKKEGGLLGKLSGSSSDQKQSSQTVASAGARGGLPDRDAKGGSNKSLVTPKITPAEIEAFKKGIA